MTGTEPVTLAGSYARCRAINRAHGTTYYRATALLPRDRRPHVHALYAFCRYADDIVDDLGPAPAAERAAALGEYGRRFFADLAAGDSGHPVLKAVVATARRFAIEPECFERFLRSMRMDLTVTRYETYADLLGYMEGSAAVIGEMMLPLLEPLHPSAREPARSLGLAFQLTNFIRDVGEDLDRNRVYLPQEDLRRFGADPWRREVTPEWRALLRFEIARARDLYRSARSGLAMLPPRSARCVGAAHALYGRILDRVEAQDYDVFTRRARVPAAEKVLTVAGALLPSGSRVVHAARARSRLGTTGHRNP